MDKISAAILDTAEPLITALPDHASPVAREDAIRLGVLIWNALACQRLGDPEPFREALARFRALPEPQCTVMATLVGQVVERKVERYASCTRAAPRWASECAGSPAAPALRRSGPTEEPGLDGVPERSSDDTEVLPPVLDQFLGRAR